MMRRALIGALVALPLVVVAVAVTHRGEAEAQQRQIWVAHYSATAGVAPGDVLRLSAFNPHADQPATVHFHLFGADGTQACHSGAREVPPLQTIVIDVPRESPHLGRFPGDPGTGRVQLGVLALASLTRPGRGGSPAPSAVPGLEVLDPSTGGTRAAVDYFLKIDGIPGDTGNGNGGGGV